MRVSLKQSEITQAIAVYLAYKGLSNVSAADLDISYTRILKGQHQGIVAEVEIPDNGALPEKAEVKGSRVSGQTKGTEPVPQPAEAPVPAPEAKPEVAKTTEAEPGTQAAGGYTPPAEDVAPQTQVETAQAQPETQVDAQAEDTAKPADAGSSLFD